MNDSIHMGDGDRMYNCLQLMYLCFKDTECYKYAHACLETFAQIRFLLSERISARLCFIRTVNFIGKQDSNYPKYLDVEHNNKLIKSEVH